MSPAHLCMTYTKIWGAFDPLRIIAIVPPVGSIGFDNKLFAFWHLQGDAHVKVIYRLETSIKVNEFRDLHTNPRCLLESQVLSLHVRKRQPYNTTSNHRRVVKTPVGSSSTTTSKRSPRPPNAVTVVSDSRIPALRPHQ
ncbi:hypothetical protein B0H17DRAFT_349737 [Mycena rosella]|uniref:Uncharacterized protein n=1 Tax=Mycena rosella TaxID=1033263 RepID=A0AAD7G253_MYCRO|nr:hypothetical protein B0H17DRAFT_349737 [Mycena rosella]